MRQLRVWINLLVLFVPLLLLGISAVVLVRHLFAYLNSGARLAGTLSREATLSLGREVRIRDVKITGNLWSLSAPNRVDLYGVEVAEGKTLAEGVFAGADKVSVWYNLSQVLFTTDPHVSLVDEIQLVHPQASLARDARGRWNFAQLLKPKKPSGRPFVDKLSFLSGTLFYTDLAFPHPPGVPFRPLRTRIDRLSGVVLLRPDKSAAFDIAGIGEPQIVRDFHAAGIVELKPMQFDLRLAANRVVLPFVGERLVAPTKARVGNGLADLDVSALYTPTLGNPPQKLDLNRLDVNGSVKVAGLSATSPQLDGPLDSVDGTATFTTDSVQADMTGRYAGAGISLHGTALGLVQQIGSLQGVQRNRPASPILSVQGSLQNADIARLVHALHLDRHLSRLPTATRAEIMATRGFGNLGFQLDGPLDNPTATVTGRLDRAEYGRYRADNVDVHALLASRVISADIHGRYAEGDAIIHAQVATDRNGAFQIEAHGRGLELASMGLPLRQRLSGTGQIDLTMQGERGRTPNISAQVELSGAKLDKLTFDTVYARAQTDRRNLMLSALRAESGQGFAQASGRMDLASHTLNMNVAAQELDIGALIKLFRPGGKQEQAAALPSMLPENGVGDLRGTITGTFAHPVAHGHVTAIALQPKGNGSYSVVSDFDLSRDALTLRNGVVRRFLGRVQFAGTVAHPFTPQRSVALTAQVQNADVADLIHTAGIDTQNIAISGQASTDSIAVEGPLNALRIAHPFTATLQNAFINDLPIDSATVQAQYGRTGLEILRASAQVAGGTLTASGHVGQDKKIDLAVGGDKIGLGALAAAVPDENLPAINGTVAFRGRVDGTTSAPAARLETATATDLTYNAFRIGTLQGSGSYADKKIQLQDVTLSEAQVPGATGDRIDIPSLTYDTATKQVATPANQPIRITAVPVQRLRDLFLNTPSAATEGGKQAVVYMSRVSGAISGTVALTGEITDPQAAVTWNATDLSLDGNLITAFNGSARLTKEEAVIPALHLESAEQANLPPNAVIDGHADIHYHGDLSADVTGNNVSLALLQRLVQGRQNPGYDVTGTASFIGVTAGGKTNSPDLDVSLSLRGVGYHNVRSNYTLALDSVDVSHATIREGSVTADDIQLAKNVSRAVPQVTAVVTDRAQPPAPPPGQTPANDVIEHYTATAHGSVGFTWKPPFVPEDAKLDLGVTIPRQSLRMLTAFAPVSLPDTQGTLSATGRVTGTRAQPNVSGSLGVEAPQLRMAQLETGLRNVVGSFTFEGDHLTANMTAQAHVFKPGQPASAADRTDSPITLQGSLPLGFGAEQHVTSGLRLTDNRFYFEENRIPVANSGNVRGTANVDLSVTGSLLEPTLAGTVNVHDTLLTLPRSFGGTGTGGFALPITPSFDLHLIAGNNARLVGPLLDVKATGRADLTGRLSKTELPNLRGQIALLSGRFTLPTARFTILPPGSISILYPVREPGTGQPTMQVNVDLRAQTSLTATSMFGEQRRYKVIVTARGPLMGDTTEAVSGQPRLALNFQTDPPDLATSQQELTARIAGSLVGINSINQFGRNPGQALAAELSNVFTSSVLPSLFQGPAQALGFEELSIGYDPVQRLNLTISRQLFGPLYVTYLRSLTATQEMYDLKVSLRFKNRYQLSWETDDQRTQRVLLEGVWKF